MQVLALFFLKMQLEIQRHSVFSGPVVNLVPFFGGEVQNSIQSVAFLIGGWMFAGGMDERWATEDVAWDFAPWDHKDDSMTALLTPENLRKTGRKLRIFEKPLTIFDISEIPSRWPQCETINSHVSDPSIFQLTPWGTRSEGRRLGASSSKIRWPRIHPLSLHHLTNSKSNSGLNFWVAIFEITTTAVWPFPQKTPVSGSSLKICKHMKPPMDIRHAIPNDESNHLQGIVCISGTRRRPMLSWKKSVSRNWGRYLACI